MKHLITGGCGFLGMLVSQRLLAKNEQVVILDVWRAPDVSKDVEFIEGSITNPEIVDRAMKGVDIVHHIAALVPLTKAGKQFHEVNVNGTRVVAESAARAGVSLFINTSSSTVFGKPQCPITNQSPLMPLEDYGRSKLGGEQVLKEVADKTKMPFICVRPRTIIGQGRLGIFQILFEWIMEGRNIYVMGDGTNKIQFLHADDLINAYMLLLQLQRPGYYNVGTDRFGTLEEGLTNLIKHAGTKTKVKHLPKDLTRETLRVLDIAGLSPLAPWHYLTYSESFFFDVQPLIDLGWQPRYSNDDMFRETYDQFVANFASFKNAREGSAHRRRVKEKVLWVLKQLS
ncbi:MAG TPA: NAD-dependent epimerase/dehydratase family protein [Nitrososphaera sp.]|nr:NAD-dependent epimerase/dehydratase family protein [Nitrososphaera sp.]